MPEAFAAVFVALYAAHLVGDHWVQTGWQANNKHFRTTAGRIACGSHILSLTITKCMLLTATVVALGVTINFWWTSTALLVDALSHYWCDRRYRLKKLARLVHKDGYWDSCTVVRQPGRDAADTGPGTGSFHLDQSWHVFWLWVTALVISVTS